MKTQFFFFFVFCRFGFCDFAFFGLSKFFTLYSLRSWDYPVSAQQIFLLIVCVQNMKLCSALCFQLDEISVFLLLAQQICVSSTDFRQSLRKTVLNTYNAYFVFVSFPICVLFVCLCADVASLRRPASKKSARRGQRRRQINCSVSNLAPIPLVPFLHLPSNMCPCLPEPLFVVCFQCRRRSTVRCRVRSDRKIIFRLPRNRICKWEVSGAERSAGLMLIPDRPY